MLELLAYIFKIAFALFLICIPIEIVRSIILRIKHKAPYDKCENFKDYVSAFSSEFLYSDNSAANLALFIVVMVGLGITVHDYSEAKYVQYHGIGSGEHEEAEVYCDYDALLYTHSGDLTYIESYVPCVATIVKTSSGGYSLEYLKLPYGKSLNANAVIKGETLEFGVMYEIDYSSTNDALESAEIIVLSPATEMSWDYAQYYSAQYRHFLASKESDTFHFPDCKYVDQIKVSNLIYFSNEIEAELFGYEICSYCYEHRDDFEF